ncbi:MAG TPA: addiction module antidote protein [Candidatus Elarobacter sp.]|nr:addiction module antidote protein [Candidatus Elarobacter sp.]
MSTVFIGGSRRVSRLPNEVKKRLDNVITSRHRVVVGDANGADKAVQKYLHEAAYNNVTVFCSGKASRNNIGQWKMHPVLTPKSSTGFEYYAAKDREMAREADFGLMVWDGKSIGTVLNVLRLVRAGKIAVLYSVPEGQTINFKTTDDWQSFISVCGVELLRDLHARATADEWIDFKEAPAQRATLFDRIGLESRIDDPSGVKSEDALTAEINAALATGEAACALSALGHIAKSRGMTQVAQDTGLARESLYRALATDGNPEFATVLKVMASIGLCLKVSKVP